MTWLLIATLVINVVLATAVIILWKRSFGQPKDDPRLSRGLQLLQSKISVLEDLSDRTDRQVKQLVELLEMKTRQIQKKVNLSDQQIQKIDQSMRKSLEVANIFQDKIPHEEIIKRQTSAKYVQAAQLAHQGKTVDEIVEVVGLPKGEVEFIAKVNRKELVFDEKQLPAWASTWSGNQGDGYFDKYSVNQLKGQPAEKNYAAAFDIPEVDLTRLEKIGVEFKETCRSMEDSEEVKIEATAASSTVQESTPVQKSLPSERPQQTTLSQKLDTALATPKNISKPKNSTPIRDVEVRPFKFPVIE
ncbi:MAG: DUF2802 domain-containing protein [Bdellovibrionales bacterium]